MLNHRPHPECNREQTGPLPRQANFSESEAQGQVFVLWQLLPTLEPQHLSRKEYALLDASGAFDASSSGEGHAYPEFLTPRNLRALFEPEGDRRISKASKRRQPLLRPARRQLQGHLIRTTAELPPPLRCFEAVFGTCAARSAALLSQVVLSLFAHLLSWNMLAREPFLQSPSDPAGSAA